MFAVDAVEAQPSGCEDGPQSSGATFRICMPASNWNGELVVYAHGYVSPTRPTGIPEDQMTLPGSTLRVDQVVTVQGYGFVTSGYATNGLAISQGLADLVDAVDIFAAIHGDPDRVIIVGISDGGLIAALAVEERFDKFDGGVALCGTYGDYPGQTDYFGDFRVLFDYYFPGVMPPTAVDIPKQLLDTWDDTYYPETVEPVITASENVTTVAELFSVAAVAHDSSDSESWASYISRLLWYNVHATEDAKDKLGGQPYENQERIYSGSTDDNLLNQDVARFSADDVARATLLADYETGGAIRGPLVTVHTRYDPLVPYWHAERYTAKIEARGKQLSHQHIGVDAYGHCSFSLFDVQNAFNALTSLFDNPVQETFLPLIAQ
jgi:pimeloyl-ACP methyl ester carboxylesterase